jgi:hypothetical protein
MAAIEPQSRTKFVVPQKAVEPEPGDPRPASYEGNQLPVPPSDEPAAYARWLHDQPPKLQAKIGSFCRTYGLNYEPSCGGIGPHHIPVPPPPSIPAIPGQQPSPEQRAAQHAHDEWEARLTPAQRSYYHQRCRLPGEISQLCGGTPLVVAFDNQPVAFTAGGRFAFTPGEAMATDWPTATTPWIALDLDGKGAIDSGAELFGSFTRLPDGSLARDGFAALAALDANHDGKIDRDDPAFAKLVLWADRDGDRRSTPDELVPLASVIVSISLDVRIEPRCDDRMNCEREKAAMRWRDAAGALHDGTVVDIHLPYR